MTTPICDFVRRYAEREPLRLHMPGHKGETYPADITEVGGAGPVSFTAQAICDVCERSTIALRSSEAITMTDPSVQPLVTLSLVKI